MTPGSLQASLEGLLPLLESCDSLTLVSGDVVIHAPGFEDRTMAIADSVMSTSGVRAVLLDYLPFNPKNRLRDVRDGLSALGVQIEDALTQVLLNTVYPSRLCLINGRPPLHRWREQATAWIHDQVRREWEEDNPIDPSAGDGVPLPKRVVSTLYYQETVSLLLNLYWSLSAKHRILLAPAGSKMQAVGCYLVKALHPDIHIEYPSPEGFSQEYSSGIGTRWLLDLGRFSKRLSAIANAERREYLEIPT